MTGTNVVAFFTDGGDPATGLSPTVRIRDLADSSLVVTDAAMTEVGDGFYTYYFATYLDTKDYTIRGDGGATLNGSERYTSASNELGDTNDAISNIKQGGGMVVQYPANIINKEDIKFRKELKKLLMIIQSKVDIVVDVQGKDLNLDEVNTRIDASMADILKMISGNSEDQKDSMDQEFNKLVKRGEETHKEFMERIVDFTDEIVILKENSKLLPNTVNSQLIASNNKNLSKFKSLTSEISNIDKKIDVLNTSTSKLSEEESNEIISAKKEIQEKISKLQDEIKISSENIPKLIDEKISVVEEKMEGNNKTVLSALDKYEESHKEISEEIKALKEISEIDSPIVDGMNQKIISLGTNLSELTKIVPTSDDLNQDVTKLNSRLDLIKDTFDSFKVKNVADIKKINESIPKLTQKRDLNYTQETINRSIKDLQANNTKKIKILRDNISGLSSDLEITKKENSEDLSKMKEQIAEAAEESDLHAQLELIKGEEEKNER